MQAKPEIELLAQRIEHFVVEARRFMQTLVSAAATGRSGKKRGLLCKAAGTVVNAANAGARVLDNILHSSENAAKIAEYHLKLNRFLNDLSRILHVDSLITVKPTDILAVPWICAMRLSCK
ncbi:hypothetical protein EON65_41000 [archaeon]|nr:MAG: hypothetical protein EON65_41000 [archaeon]